MSMTGIIVILVAALILFGPEELPRIARTVGKLFSQGQRIYQGYMKDVRSMLDEPLQDIKKVEKDLTKTINSSLDLSSLTGILEEKKTDGGSSGRSGSEDLAGVNEDVDVAEANQDAGSGDELLLYEDNPLNNLPRELVEDTRSES